jgi:DNA-binding GntR family transcriptional regulator
MEAQGEPLAEDSAAKSPQNLSSLAYAALSRMIHGHQLRGGEAILEAKLADVLKISRTPLREALQRLEGEGLVVKNASRSYMVRGVDLAEYLQSLRVREILEPEAAALSIGRLDGSAIPAIRAQIEALHQSPTYVREEHWRSDASLHNLFVEACGNQVMIAMIRSLRATTHLFEIARLQDRLVPDNTEHLRILDALALGDAKAVRKAVQNHIRSLHRFAVSVVS